MLTACSHDNDKGAEIKNSLYDLSFSEKNTEPLNPKHERLVNLIDGLLQQDLSHYKNLYSIQLKRQRGDTAFILGWIQSQQEDTLNLISISGDEYQLDQSNILN
jgi:hypothetical protein